MRSPPASGTSTPQVRHDRGERQEREARHPIAEARQHRFAIDWTGPGAVRPPRPTFLGVRTIEDHPLDELVERIDWTPFFATWELAGRIPRSSTTRRSGAAARDLLRDATALLTRIVDERLLTAKAAFGFWPANSVGDDIVLYASDEPRRRREPSSTRSASRWSSRPAARTSPWPTSRRRARPASRTTSAPSRSPPATASTSWSPRFEADHDDYSAILAKALADRLAEAFAERLHELVRRELWGYSPDERLPNDAIIREEYQGIRPAPGYPACPDHTEKRTMFELLEAEERAGIRLTESFAMWPGAAVSGYYFWHPQAHYFGLGRIGPDQLEDYARAEGRRRRDDGPLAGAEPRGRLGQRMTKPSPATPGRAMVRARNGRRIRRLWQPSPAPSRRS